MTYTANAIANFFLDLAEKENRGISPMKLQKLLYYAYGWWMGHESEPLFDEHIQAWNYGPVVQSIYHEFKRFGNDAINARARSGFSDEDDELPTTASEGELGNFLKAIWGTYGKHTATKLSNMTHLPGTPWSEIADQHEDGIPPNTVIPDDVILRHFKPRAERANAKAESKSAE